MYSKPTVLCSFAEEDILGRDTVAFADCKAVAPGWSHYAVWTNYVG